ncbi:hypothetical protein E6O75_ATG10952 [Venturia nashicola]|uniref:Uncharacterized protein n=1 Tax=Venturia nashicola TaxID=86259 RepID=A0A4Z1P3W5_9PEZI|nr:hypothetical protein E6O75_ATG10952 [Venturia nashicola]
MRSILTRVVFRHLLRNEPITHRDCLYRFTHTLRHHGRRPLPAPQRRTLFGFTRARPREKSDSDLEPGLELMQQTCAALESRMRTPNKHDIVSAWRAYFYAKAVKKTALNDTQAATALKVLQYLEKLSKERDHGKPLLPANFLKVAAEVLGHVKFGKDHREVRRQESSVALAKELYRILQERLVDTVPLKEMASTTTTKGEDESGPSTTIAPEEHEDDTEFSMVELPEEASSEVRAVELERATRKARLSLISVLCDSGYAKEARDLITTRSASSTTERKEWRQIIRGFEMIEDVDELRATASILQSISPSLEQSLQSNFVVAYANAGSMVDLKACLDISRIGQISPTTLHRVITACLKENEMDFGRRIVRAITENGALQTTRGYWDSIFLWALGTGKGVDEVNRMMEVMRRTNDTFVPNSQTIHILIMYANSRNDPYLAERLVDLGRTWKIPPDATMYLLQMDYRLSVGDIEGARTSYQKAQMHDVEENEDVPRIHRLLQAMCKSNRYSFESIMTVMEDLNGRNIRFPPETVAALTTLHLLRKEYHDVVDLLKTHIPHISIDDRAVVRDVLLNMCLDRRNSLARVWDTYMICQAIFSEVTREVRTKIMQEFFWRKRCDMAVHVFNHMREHSSEAMQPTTDTYAIALVGAGKLHDDEGLEVFHNALKLDMNIEPCTKLYNALMLGYVGCEMPRRALTFWEDIVSSREGPSYDSLLIVFKVTEEVSFGERKALQVWKQLRDLDIEITRDLVAAYVGSLQGNYLYDDAKKFILECEESLGIKPDAVILGTMYNSSRLYAKQVETEQWMKEHFPDVWEEMLKLGRIKREDSLLHRINVELELQP